MIQGGILLSERFQDACNLLRLVKVTGDLVPGGTQEAVTYLLFYVHGDGIKPLEKKSPQAFQSRSGRTKGADGVVSQKQCAHCWRSKSSLGNVLRQAGPKKWPVGWANPGGASAEAEEKPRRTSEETQEIQETQETRETKERRTLREGRPGKR